MFVLFTFIFLVYFDVYTEATVVEVIKSGIYGLKKNDMVIIFYVTVRHHGSKPLRTMVTMVECCEKITQYDTDCDLMELYGGDFGILKPGTEKNLSLIYPNVYGFNRKGSCIVKVLHHCLENSEHAEIYHRIEFDTTVSTETVPQALNGWYDPETLTLCESPDLDPFDHCNPVDCNLKYSGNRNYYNGKWKLCQKVPVCLADLKKELPDVVYVPISNTCKNLEKAVTEEMVKLLAKNGAPKTKKPSTINIRCHHGQIDPRTGLCVCDYGWKSQPFDPECSNSKQSTYSMCNIKCIRNDEYALLPPLLGLLLGFWFSFCVICCEKYNYFLGYKNEPYLPQQECYFPLKGENDNACHFHHSHATTMAYRVTTRNFISDFSIPDCNISPKKIKNPKVS